MSVSIPIRPPPTAEPTESGYTKAFEPPFDEEAIEFFLQNGYIVSHGAITPNQIHNAKEELWTYLEKALWCRPPEPCTMANIHPTNTPAMMAAHSWKHNGAVIHGILIPYDTGPRTTDFQDGPPKHHPYTSIPHVSSMGSIHSNTSNASTSSNNSDQIQSPQNIPDTPHIAVITDINVSKGKSTASLITNALNHPRCVAILLYSPQQTLSKILFTRHSKSITEKIAKSSTPILSVPNIPPLMQEYTITIATTPTWPTPKLNPRTNSIKFPVTPHAELQPENPEDPSHNAVFATERHSQTLAISRHNPSTWESLYGWPPQEDGKMGNVPAWTTEIAKIQHADHIQHTAAKLMNATRTTLSTLLQTETQQPECSPRPPVVLRPAANKQSSREWLNPSIVKIDFNPWNEIEETSRLHPHIRSKLPPSPKTNTYKWEGDLLRETCDHKIETNPTPEHSPKNTPQPKTITQPYSKINIHITLTDNKGIDTGGIQVPPTSHKRLKTWTEENSHSQVAKLSQTAENILFFQTQKSTHNPAHTHFRPLFTQSDLRRIVAPAGAAIFTCFDLPYGTTPNMSNKDECNMMLHHVAIDTQNFPPEQRERRQIFLRRIFENGHGT